MNKGHLLGPGPEPLHILPQVYDRKKEVNPNAYKDGASYKIPQFEKRNYDVESPVKAYINNPSPPRKPKKPVEDPNKRRGISPASKYYLGLSQRANPDDNRNKDNEPRKTGFVMTETLRRTLRSAQPPSDDEPEYIPEPEIIEHEIRSDPNNTMDENLRLLFLDALKSKLSIIEGYDENVANLTRTQIEGIVWNEKQQGRIEEKQPGDQSKNFEFHFNEAPKDMKEKAILASSLKNSMKKSRKSKKSKKFNSTTKKGSFKGSRNLGTTVSCFDPSEKEIIKKKMIDRMLRSREPPRKTRRITKLDMGGRSKTPTRKSRR